MKVLFAASELAPFSRAGGLGDSVSAMVRELGRKGVQAGAVTPLYRCVRERYKEGLARVCEKTVTLGWRKLYCGLWKGELSGLPVWFIDNREFFDRDRLYGYEDDALRFAFFAKAVIECLKDYGKMPDILHCSDWESALAIIYLKDGMAADPSLQRIRTVYTIHNAAYQGQFGQSLLEDTFGLAPGWYEGGLGYEYEGRHDVNLTRGAVLMADAVTTVSPSYARSLQQAADLADLKLYGIQEGIEKGRESLRRRKETKLFLQKAWGLKEGDEWPLICCVFRLVEPKGAELVRQILPGLMNLGAELIVCGRGDAEYTEFFREAARKWPGRVAVLPEGTEKAEELLEGADLCLIPEKNSIAGTAAERAMAYGAVPVVHETGGLKDAVRPWSYQDGKGDGFSFRDFGARDLYLAVLEAIKLYYTDRKAFEGIRKRALEKDFSWEKCAGEYMRVYESILDGGEGEPLSFEEAFSNLKDACLQRKEKKSGDTRRVLQVTFTGRAQGTFYLDCSESGVRIEPYSYDGADSYVEASYDSLLAMAQGKTSPDALYLTGRLKVSGKISSVCEIRDLLGRAGI